MAKRKPQMPGNMGNMMKQVQKMQTQMQKKAQEDIENKEFTASAGGGAITVKVNGKKEMLGIEIDEDVVDPDDVEMLQDLIMAAVNEAMRTADETMSKEMGKLTGGMNIPGLF